MQIKGTQETMFENYFEHRITGKSLQELGCSEVVLTKLHFFELHSEKSVTQIIDLSDGWLSENEAYELKKLNKLARTAQKTFGKKTRVSEISDLTLYRHPCLYQISTYKKEKLPAPLLWVCGWLLLKVPTAIILENGGSNSDLAKVKNLVAILKNRDVMEQDVKNIQLNLNRSEIKEINCLRKLFKLKSNVKAKRIFKDEKKEIEAV